MAKKPRRFMATFAITQLVSIPVAGNNVKDALANAERLTNDDVLPEHASGTEVQDYSWRLEGVSSDFWPELP